MKKGERRQADEREALIARLESRRLLETDYPVLVRMAKKGRLLSGKAAPATE